jgi:uncharacterized protein
MSDRDWPPCGLPDVTGAPVLVVMARPLVAGHVKTRLAAAIGDDEALVVYERLLASTLARAEHVADARLVLALVPGHAAWPAHGSRWAPLVQRGETLAERLAAVFDDLFAGGARAVVAVGSDSPAIPAEYLELAFARLAPGRIVLGPAADGGYYALGVDRATWSSREGTARVLVADAPMGESSLLSWTLSEATRRGLEAAQLPLWLDVDEAADLPVLERLSADGGLRGEATVALGLREVYLHVTNRCGSACLHCYNRSNPLEPGELVTGEWRRVIDDCVALGATSFVFLGGDPLLRDDLGELLEHVTGRHRLKARLFFNSPITSTLAAELALAGNGRLQPLVSIDGPEEIHDGLRFAGNYAAVTASIANLLAAGLEPVANTVLLRPTLPGLPALARELKRAGVARLHLILPHQRGGLPENLDLVPTGAEMLAGLRALLTVAREIDLTVDNLAAWRRRLESPQDFCTAGCRDLAVDPYGRVHACTITTGDPAFVAGDLRRDSLEHIWRSSPGLRLLRAARARDRADCAACPVVDACGGDCWMQAHYAARVRDLPGGPGAPFPYCDLVRPVFAELLVERQTGAQPAASACPPSAGCGGQATAGAADYALFDCI